MFGREARLPIDVRFGNAGDGRRGVKHVKYVERMKEDLRNAFDLSLQNAQKTEQRNKRLYDQRVKFCELGKGDSVLVKNLATTGKQKLRDKWSSVPYLVLEKLENLPVYRVKPKTGTGGVRTLHRDHLLPIGEGVRINLPSEREDSSRRVVTRSKTVERRQKKVVNHERENSESVNWNSESDDSSDCVYYPVERTVNLERLSFPSTEGENVQSPTRSREDPDQVEVTRGEESSAQMEENIEESVSEEEGIEAVNVASGEEELGRGRNYPKRMIKFRSSEVQKLSYDELGKSSDKPLTIVYRGMVVKIEESSKKNACRTLWCHPMATCEHCVQQKMYPKSEVLLQF